jgi:putative endonuclease
VHGLCVANTSLSSDLICMLPELRPWRLRYTRGMSRENDSWQVYIVRCADETLYTGIARDLQKRIDEHNHGRLAARYTRARRPVVLVYSESCESRSQALRREMAIKKLSRLDKEQLCRRTGA